MVRNKYNLSRNHLFDGLINKTKLFGENEWKTNFWLPEGAYFVVGDISDAKFKQEKTQRYALYGGLLVVLLFGIIIMVLVVV